MVSIIIPAHNEEKVIGATLKELVAGVKGGDLEIIVVCNGCSDNTAGIVSSFGDVIKCIITPVPSKTNAFNLGEEAASGFPRIYQDADVVLSLDSVRKIAEILNTGHFLAAAPRMQMNLKHSSWPVRSYYDIWQQLPYVKEGMIGTGVFAMSEMGRKRFGKFPDIIADDGYVRALFKTNERTSVDTCYSLVRAPVDLEGLLKIKTRSRLGRYELKQKFPELLLNEKKSYGNAIFKLISQVRLWAKIPVYLYVNLRSRILANNYARNQGFTGWTRDESSRNKI